MLAFLMEDIVAKKKREYEAIEEADMRDDDDIFFNRRVSVRSEYLEDLGIDAPDGENEETPEKPDLTEMFGDKVVALVKSTLSSLEKEVLFQWSIGRSDGEIARELGLSGHEQAKRIRLKAIDRLKRAKS